MEFQIGDYYSRLGYGSVYGVLGLGYGNGYGGPGLSCESVLRSLATGGTLWNNGFGLSGLSVPYQNFASALQKALGNGQSLRQGKGVILSFPASAAGKEAEGSKKPGEMTQEEYRDYICDQISALPDSVGGGRNLRGVLVLKEDALARMQKEPSYEKQVMEMLRKDLQTQSSTGSAYFGYRVIGKSEAECYKAGTAVRGAAAVSCGKEKNLEETTCREGLAERLRRNRAARIQERAAERLSGKHNFTASV